MRSTCGGHNISIGHISDRVFGVLSSAPKWLSGMWVGGKLTDFSTLEYGKMSKIHQLEYLGSIYNIFRFSLPISDNLFVDRRIYILLLSSFKKGV